MPYNRYHIQMMLQTQNDYLGKQIQGGKATSHFPVGRSTAKAPKTALSLVIGSDQLMQKGVADGFGKHFAAYVRRNVESSD